MSHKPLVLMTTSNICSSQLEPIIGDSEAIYSDRATANVIIQAGGLPLYLPSADTITSDMLNTYLDRSDCLVITGANSNVNPIQYGEDPIQNQSARIDDERDGIDIALIRLAYKRRLPILGICKGMQIINVALGGTLYQDIKTQKQKNSDHDILKTNRANLTHLITTTRNSLAEKIFGADKIRVNGGHQQAVKRLSPLLNPTATTHDGIVEIYEGKDYPFLVGVQFHPELRAFDPRFFGLFQHFIAQSTSALVQKEATHE